MYMFEDQFPDVETYVNQKNINATHANETFTDESFIDWPSLDGTNTNETLMDGFYLNGTYIDWNYVFFVDPPTETKNGTNYTYIEVHYNGPPFQFLNFTEGADIHINLSFPANPEGEMIVKWEYSTPEYCNALEMTIQAKPQSGKFEQPKH